MATGKAVRKLETRVDELEREWFDQVEKMQHWTRKLLDRERKREQRALANQIPVDVGHTEAPSAPETTSPQTYKAELRRRVANMRGIAPQTPPMTPAYSNEEENGA